VEKVYKCDRCKVKHTILTDLFPDNLKHLGWIRLLFRGKNLTLCPACASELKRFLGGSGIVELRKQKEWEGE